MISPALSQRQIERIRDSFVQVLLAPEDAGRLFYDTLFRWAPDTRPLFRGDMEEQGRVLIMTLAKVVAALERFEDMVPTLRDLARRHVAYGVEERHYAIVGAALLHTIRSFSPTPLDESCEAAWTTAYGLVSDTMIAAAYR